MKLINRTKNFELNTEFGGAVLSAVSRRKLWNDVSNTHARKGRTAKYPILSSHSVPVEKITI